jgi:galactokinase/mevalonate kinase-like predicted kinase
MSKGASAGKLCGAGGSGFVLFLVPPQKKSLFLKNFSEDQIVQDIKISDGVMTREF